MLSIVGYVNPYDNLVSNRMDLFNETLILITNYHLFMFTDFLSDLEMRGKVGQSLVVVTIFNVAVNLSVVSLQSLARIGREAKLEYLKWKQAK
jgi:hypothetical protein